MDELIKKYVIKGKDLTDAVIELAESSRKGKYTLVTESELLEEAKKVGLATGRTSLVQYRKAGVLKDKDGPWVFQNDKNRVVFKLEKMLPFLKERGKAPKSRLKPNARSKKRAVSRKAVTQ